MDDTLTRDPVELRPGDAVTVVVDRDGGTDVEKLLYRVVLGALALGSLVILLMSLPDIRRYLRIRRM